MKKKSRNSALKRKHEFRFHKVIVLTNNGKQIKIAHPGYIFIEKGNLYIYVSLTHSNIIEGFKVLKLRKNPNPKDSGDSYYIAEIKEDTKDRFSRRLNDWRIDPEDDLDIQKLFENK